MRIIEASLVVIMIMITPSFFASVASLSRTSMHPSAPTPIDMLMNEFTAVPHASLLGEKNMHLCVVTAGLYPIVRVGGVARAFKSLLTYAGDPANITPFTSITVLYPGGLSDDNKARVRKFWSNHSRIRFEFVDPSTRKKDYGTAKMVMAARVRDSLSRIHEKTECSVILSHDLEAPTYYVVVDRSFSKIRPLSEVPTVTWVHSRYEYTDMMNARHPSSAQAAVIYDMERMVTEKADGIISPSHWYIQWMQAAPRSYKLPRSTHRIFNPMHGSPSTSSRMPLKRTVDYSGREVFVYFTRVEILKGIWHFLHVAEKMCPRKGNFVVTGFTPSPKTALEIEAAVQRINAVASRPCVEFARDVTTLEAAVQIIRDRRGILLGMSLADSSSYVMMEMFEAGVPFITYETGGIPELFSCNACMVRPSGEVSEMVKVVEGILSGAREGSVDVVTRRFDEERSLFEIINILFKVANEAKVHVPHRDHPPFSIAVAVTSKNRPELLRQSLKTCALSVSKCPENTCSVIVVDSSDVQNSAAVASVVAEVRKTYPFVTMKIVQEDASATLTRVRNRALREGHADAYTCFFDDDDRAGEDMLLLYRRGIISSRMPDVIGSFARVVKTRGAQGEVESYTSLSLAGPSSTEPLLHMDTKANFCVRNGKALAIGGHSEIMNSPTALFGRAPYVDWAFIVKCSLRGLRFSLVPEETYEYVRYDASPQETPGKHTSLFYDANDRDVYHAKKRIVQEIMEFVPARLRTSVELSLMNALPRTHNTRTI